MLLFELLLEFKQELVDHVQDRGLVQAIELDDCIQAVAEFGREELADGRHCIRAVVLSRKSDRCPRRLARTR